MPSTIKNERVSALATPVEVLESRLAELNPSTRRAGMAAQLVEIGRNCAAAAPERVAQTQL